MLQINDFNYTKIQRTVSENTKFKPTREYLSSPSLGHILFSNEKEDNKIDKINNKISILKQEEILSTLVPEGNRTPHNYLSELKALILLAITTNKVICFKYEFMACEKEKKKSLIKKSIQKQQSEKAVDEFISLLRPLIVDGEYCFECLEILNLLPSACLVPNEKMKEINEETLTGLFFINENFKHIALRLFSKITINEIKSYIKKSDKIDQLDELEKKNFFEKHKNIREFILLSKKCTNYFINSILSTEKSLEQAVKIEILISLADFACRHKNYEFFNAIMNCLAHPTLDKLNVAWKLISENSSRKFKEMKELLTSKRWQLYSKMIKSEGECVPYLGLSLNQLVKSNDSSDLLLSDEKTFIFQNKCLKMETKELENYINTLSKKVLEEKKEEDAEALRMAEEVRSWGNQERALFQERQSSFKLNKYRKLLERSKHYKEIKGWLESAIAFSQANGPINTIKIITDILDFEIADEQKKFWLMSFERLVESTLS